MSLPHPASPFRIDGNGDATLKPTSFQSTCSVSSSSSSSSDDDVNVDAVTNTHLEKDSSKYVNKNKNSGSQKKQGGGFLSLQKWLLEVDNFIEEEGVMFRSKLSSRDVRDIKRARLLFHVCSVVPPILYYWFSKVDTPPKFPASISHTIRKGTPQRVQVILWTTGWYLLSRAIRRAGSDILKKFSLKMFLTGVVTTNICALGQNALSDAIHFAGAGLYMIQHVVFLKVLKQHPTYRRLFYGSFLTLLTSIVGLRRLERKTGLPSESTAHGSVRNRMIQMAKLPSNMKSSIFLWELLLMISENLLFTSFVHGMPSGLVDKEVQMDDEHLPANEDSQNRQQPDRTAYLG